jgi:hypothetical protein
MFLGQRTVLATGRFSFFRAGMKPGDREEGLYPLTPAVHHVLAGRCCDAQNHTGAHARQLKYTVGVKTGGQLTLDINLAVGYFERMTTASEAAKELAKRSVAARRHKWGKAGFRKKMQEWGKLGGRPSKKGKRDAT